MPDALTDALLDAALLRGAFTLRSGVTSDRYFDKFRVSCDPALLAPAAERLVELVREVAPTATRLVAPELGAVPLAVAMSLASGLPYAIVRGEAKAYGSRNRIEGVIEPGETAVMVEDVVTSGGAVLAALAVVREAGLVVHEAVCLLDRRADGGRALGDAGVDLHAVLDLDDLDRAFDAGLGTEVPA